MGVQFRLVYLRPPPVALGPLNPWVEKIAERVLARYGMEGESTLDDLISAGYVRVLELLRDFSPDWPRGYRDPDAAFRGWAYREVLTTIQREAARLLGGGTFRSPRRDPGRQLVVARPISDLRNESDERFEVEAPTTEDVEPFGPATDGKPLDLPESVLAAAREFAESIEADARRENRDPVMSIAPGPDGTVQFQWNDTCGRRRAVLNSDGSVSSA